HKQLQFLCLSSLFILFVGCKGGEVPTWEEDFKLSIMSFNLRFDTEEDGDNKWDNRKEACLSMLGESNPSIFGIQEGLQSQVSFLDENLPDYHYVGVGRDDGETAGEYSAIYYLKDRFELLDQGNFWLSESPDVPSLGWDANNIRIVSWAALQDREHNKTLYVFNTHFDHKGKTAREESAKLIIEKVKEIATAEAAVYLIGDFNVLAGNSVLEPILDEYDDARQYAGRGEAKSYNGWGRWYLNRDIDFIFFKNVEGLSFQTISADYGVPYLSDHYPIIGYFKY
ncbi:MAG: endonuclease/exonuclease/phosphatase family protein, partial [Bacteroidota bacterium]